MKIKAVVQGNAVAVKVLVQHPMETGRRKDEKGALVPAQYITELTAACNGETVFHAELGPGVSKDPFISFEFDGAKAGDTLKVSWVDNKGGAESLEAPITAM
jgi:sulfur-oxidizing protein SoxZ